MDPIIPQPEQLSVQPTKHFLNKKFIITFAILILLGGSAYAGIWYWQNQQVAQEVVPTFTPRPSASTMPDTIAGTSQTVITRTSEQIASANSRRVADVLSARVSLELYSDNNSTYPISIGTTAQARWMSLGQVLIKAGILSTWMQDPNQQNGFSYDYRTSPDQKSFVIKAVMEPEDSQASKIYNPSNYLQYMNRGTIFGMDCSGSAICVTIMKGDDGGYK